MTATKTANGNLLLSDETQIQMIARTAARKIEFSVASRDETLAKIATGGLTDSFTIDKLIRTEAELRAWSEINRFITAQSELDKNDDELLARLIQYIGRYALDTHRINSTSNVDVEIETMRRLAFVSAYNFITGNSNY
jgi:uncharacterized Fe-S cluster-containing radical SAM superfamily enzyme